MQRIDCKVQVDSDEVRVVISGLPEGRALLLGNCILPYLQQAVSEAMERPPEKLVTVVNDIETENFSKQ